MLPVPETESVADLLKRVSAYAKGAKPIRIFVKDTFEIVDHKLTVGACFTDYMEVVVLATPEVKDVLPTPTKQVDQK
jgi:hypothetical protein